MLDLMLPATDDEPQVVLHLEHSLVSISKWESEHKVPFFGREQMEKSETVSYVSKMLLDPPPYGNLEARLRTENFVAVTNYINRSQTATWFREEPPSRVRPVVTSELVYYWMIDFGIPFVPTETWHFSRLMTLVQICGNKRTKPKKMSRQAQAEEMRRINAERRSELGTTG